MEKTLNFEQYKYLMNGLLTREDKGLDAKTLHPLVLAYIGDGFFSLFVRMKLINLGGNKVRILHDYDAKIVSAVMQAFAMVQLLDELTEEENSIFKRGRNTKSSVPKSASVAEYRLSTGFETLLGYLYLTGQEARLMEICEKAFSIISRKMTNEK